MTANPVFTFARVDPETLEVTLKYNTNGGPKWAPEDLECSIPFDVLADTATKDSEGVITLQEDPVKVAAKTQAQWTALRLQRDSLLSASDWRVLPFSPLTQEQQQAWADYRSALRALPQFTQDPGNVTWPTSP